MGFVVEGWEINAVGGNSSQVNTVTPTFMCWYKFPVLLLGDLVDHPLNLIGFGGRCTRPLGFMILHVQVREIMSYDEDIVFLVIPDQSDFSR